MRAVGQRKSTPILLAWRRFDSVEKPRRRGWVHNIKEGKQWLITEVSSHQHTLQIIDGLELRPARGRSVFESWSRAMFHAANYHSLERGT